jgi:dinuclear metal center YbgI/SA1388 family protein
VTSYPLDAVLQKLSEIAPLRLAESWDNVGLLVGNRATYVERVMTCLTITPDVVQEAAERQVGLIVVHHPLPFKPLSRITSDTTTGRMLLALISNHVAVYSSHTAFDSANDGINAQWTQMLGLASVAPLEPIAGVEEGSIGSGRYGRLPQPTSLNKLAQKVAELVDAPRCRVVPSKATDSAEISKVAIACGSGGSFVAAAIRRGCDALVTGEATFHQCLEASAAGTSLILTGHFYSERFAMERLAERLARDLNGLDVFASLLDTDPLKDAI